MPNIQSWIDRLIDRSSTKPVPSLGPRELEVLKILWRFGELPAQKILEQVQGAQITLSTMQSTLERLFRKQLIKRRKSGRYYIYEAAVDQQSIISSLLADISIQISDGDMLPMISGFSDFLSQHAPSIDVSDLDKLIGQKNGAENE